MNIRFGIQIEPQLGFNYDTVEKIALNAEKVGYDSIWASDHFFLDQKSEEKNCMEAWTLLAAIAAKTNTLRLGTLVTCNSYRYPAVLAKMAATVDMISNGRLEFGIGAGWKEIEYIAYGISFPSVKDRMDQLEESIQIIKKLWTEPKVNFDGNHYQIKEAFSAPKPMQQLPPIFIGGTGKKRILNMVAKYADYCNFGWFLDPKTIPELLNALKQHCKDENRDYETVGKSYFASVIVTETEDELDKILAERAKLRNMSLEGYKKSINNLNVFYGTPEVVQQGFDHLIDLGFDYFQIMFPYPSDYEQSNKFAKFVIPKLK
ncbi:MAG: TIGR03560 family F420-dependent LLM class oxidoreductase [Candidatus Heimdallarchaeota archaeon]|nr:MAG: TIGR03560 family F420-dependent LLM class oxidoreductase [Candidatus Heimdallarchaeota archaeon]